MRRWKGVTQKHQGKKVHSFLQCKECAVWCNNKYFIEKRKHLEEAHHQQPIPSKTYLLFTREEDQNQKLQACSRERLVRAPKSTFLEQYSPANIYGIKSTTQSVYGSEDDRHQAAMILINQSLVDDRSNLPKSAKDNKYKCEFCEESFKWRATLMQYFTKTHCDG